MQAVISRTIKLFSSKEQPPSFDEVPEEFNEAAMLFKEDKKANLESIGILLSPHLKATFDLARYKRAKQMFAESGEVEAEKIIITELKFVKKNPIPTISVEAVFRLKVTDAYVKENQEDQMWQVRHGAAIAEAITVGWSIDHWGVEELDLSMGDYKESSIYIENE